MVSFIKIILYFFLLPSFFLIYTNMVWLMWLVLIYNFLSYWYSHIILWNVFRFHIHFWWPAIWKINYVGWWLSWKFNDLLDFLKWRRKQIKCEFVKLKVIFESYIFKKKENMCIISAANWESYSNSSFLVTFFLLKQIKTGNLI